MLKNMTNTNKVIWVLKNINFISNGYIWGFGKLFIPIFLVLYTQWFLMIQTTNLKFNGTLVVYIENTTFFSVIYFLPTWKKRLLLGNYVPYDVYFNLMSFLPEIHLTNVNFPQTLQLVDWCYLILQFVRVLKDNKVPLDEHQYRQMTKVSRCSSWQATAPYNQIPKSRCSGCWVLVRADDKVDQVFQLTNTIRDRYPG